VTLTNARTPTEPTIATSMPHAYWLEGHYISLSLRAKVMLLIALSLQDGFPLPYKRARDWYGVSEDSAEEGLRELGNKQLLSFDSLWRKTAIRNGLDRAAYVHARRLVLAGGAQEGSSFPS
jgi:hypothetical protein